MSRVESIDVLRGLALLGLPLTNLIYMANFTSGSVADSSDKLGASLSFAVDVLAHGRFRTIFSILFGLSLCLFYEKYGPQCIAKMRNRLFVLGVFGCVHGFVLWPGDILLNYSISGLLLLYVLRLDNTTLVKLAVCAVLIPIFILMLLIYQSGGVDFAEPTHVDMAPYGFFELLEFNFYNYLGMLALLPTITLWYIFGLMVIGVLVYRAYWQGNGGLSTPFSLLVLIPLSIFGSVWARLTFTESESLIFDLFNWLFAIPCSIALVCIGLNHSEQISKRRSILSAVGRFSLSLYLLQSVIGVWLFQFAYPMWRTNFTQTDYFLLFIGLAILQLALVWWFRRNAIRGPAEIVFANCQGYLNKRES
ncbi:MULTISPECIES: DUF418 domain-containing protein [Pseudoalteromonas]|uniref:Putative membrane protein n=1 Tax=Pseudoalteromonas luteoviolacea (strain 2ta16) TaxID=1353533 RepID=V4JHM9_PSEL2|nr:MULTISPECIES: DUF418 domain-containing protein [Pseudoalteromonas]ESP94427.1 putative membrane protein [Pseudoalteromonas luteoviolacea 2ta16]KZN32120.1 hypothetical protein N483_02975 [Pseudoalteromonas luteoviolacea NCIMB 1944]MCG7547923.1 DUF418 domain-containing protein [Pseudoalteromonas sp. Of7M-16]